MESTECINKKLMHQMRRLQTFIECPERQAEAIANHYCAHVHLAAQLREAVALAKGFFARTGTPSTKLDEFISHLCTQIKEGHFNDLGIELKWEVPVDPLIIHPWNQTITETVICQKRKMKKIRRIR